GARVRALRDGDHIARLRAAARGAQAGGADDVPRPRMRGIRGRDRAKRRRHGDRLVDGAVGVGRVELDLVRRPGREVEDASGELIGHGPADDALRMDPEQIHRAPPRRRAERAIADGDPGVVVVVAGHEQLDAERDHGGAVDPDRPGMQDVVGASAGGASGIGAATARAFAAEGARVVIADVDRERGREVAGATAGVFEAVDVGDGAAVRALVEQTVAAFRRVDVLVSNAFATSVGPIERFALDAWTRTLEVTLTAAFTGLQAVAPVMRAQGGGAVVNVASISGLG